MGYVISLNIHRRNLDASQRAMIAADLETLRHGGDRKSQDARVHPESSRSEVASKLGVSERGVAAAATVKKHGTPELQDAVRKGAASVKAAAAVAKLPDAEQRAVVAEGRAGVAAAAKASRLAAADLKILSEALIPATVDAIESGKMKIKDAEIRELVKQPAAVIKQAVSLMHVNGWPLKRAMRCIERPIDQESRVSDLINLCIREGGSWMGSFSLYRVTVEHTKPEMLRKS